LEITMPHASRTLHPNVTILLAGLALALLAGACGAPKSDTESAAGPDSANHLLPPPQPPLPATTVYAFTWFDKDQGGAVSKDWTKARDAMAALGGHRFAYSFTTMDWERESNVMAVSAWDDEQSAIRGLKVAEAQLPARGWAKSELVRRIAFDGNMGDSLFKSVVMVLPEAAAGDTAKAIADFDTVNVFMRNQPGYIASMLFTRVSGDPAYPYLIASRWSSREDLQRVGTQPEFQELRKRVQIAGVPTTYLQLMY